MNRNEIIFTNKDIVIFLIIAAFLTILFVFGLCEEYTRIEDIIRRGFFQQSFLSYQYWQLY